ncbi:MAG: histidine kinase [Anaerolineae bacterium]
MKSSLQKLDRKEELQRRLADLKARLPAHSISPTMMMELDELEEQLAEIQAENEHKE